MTINHHDLGKIDLNLLVALDALLTEQSVTRAAEKVGVGQSGMSSAPARLRKLLGDELLTRTPDGMRMTPRGSSLVEPVGSALRQLQGIVLRENVFNPATSARAFTIAAPGSVEVYLLSRLMAAVQKEAPGVSLTLRALNYATVLDELDDDRLDLAIGLMTRGQTHHKVRPLYDFSYLCLFNPELLGISAPLSMDDYLRFPHVLTSITGTERGVVDEALERVGLKRRLASTTPRFMTVPYHVKAAPLITTMVAELAIMFAEQLGLATSPVPMPLADFTISMLWHGSYDKDPAHRWLREVLLTLSRTSAGEHRRSAL